MSECAIGLPNQALKPLVSSFTPNVLQTIPVERTAVDLALPAGVETFGIPLQTVPSNKKQALNSFKVRSNEAGLTTFKLYRNGSVVLTYVPNLAAMDYEVFLDGIGKEFDEAETWSVTVTSAAGCIVSISISGREEMKRDTLISQVLA